MKQTLMAVGAHADDIEFNAGGTLSKYHQAGYEILYVMSTNNMSGSWSSLDESGQRQVRRTAWDEIMPQRKKEASAAAGFYGTEAIHLDHPQRHFRKRDGEIEKLGYGSQSPEGLAPGTPTILNAYEDPASVQRLADLILANQPEAILSHSMESGNIEHVASCLLVAAAYQKARQSGYRGMLLFWYDITPPPVASVRRRWDSFIDVSDHWQAKLDALALHACQILNVNALDLPAFGPACGCRQAEVFFLAERGDPQAHTVSPFSLEICAHER